MPDDVYLLPAAPSLSPRSHYALNFPFYYAVLIKENHIWRITHRLAFGRTHSPGVNLFVIVRNLLMKSWRINTVNRLMLSIM